MLIRTQDKKQLMTMGILYIVSVSGNAEIRTSHPVSINFYRILGSYSTEERAVEVLDKIQGAYQHNVAVFQMPEE